MQAFKIFYPDFI